MNDEVQNDTMTANAAPHSCSRTPAKEQASAAAPTISECESISPEMLTLVRLSQRQIDQIVSTVPGGAANVQDIYPLSPTQEGILFHHLLNECSDTYVLLTLLELDSKAHVDGLIEALQAVIDRHEILRSAVLWEDLPTPVQVVYRRAILPVEELELKTDQDVLEQIKERMKPEHQELKLRRAPLIKVQVARDERAHKWYALLHRHHIIFDHQSWNVAFSEAMQCMQGRAHELSAPQSYRDYVAWSLSNDSAAEAESFFRQKLGDMEEPSAPFGLLNACAEGSQLEEARGVLESALSHRIRAQAQSIGVSAARLFHAAWGLVVAHTSGRDDVTYGTVLLGAQRRSEQVQRTVGLFVNTLPLRLKLKDLSARELVDLTHRELAELARHQRGSLALAQRCSALPAAAPLFTSVLNYRYSVGHSVVDARAGCAGATGIRVIAHQYRTNFPVGLTVDNLGDGFALIAQTDRSIDPQRIIGYFQTAMESLVDALDHAPQTSALRLSVLPPSERHEVIAEFNATQAPYARDTLLQELFEERVRHTPNLIAVVYGDRSLTFTELNDKANQLARYLRERGVDKDQLVGLCVERSLEMVVGMFGILKAGGAYVPMDPDYPTERLHAVLSDAAPAIVLTQESLRRRLPDSSAQVVALDADWTEIASRSAGNLDHRALGMRSDQLAYVIYTSGSTGRPKGVMIEHRNVTSLWQGLEHIYRAVPDCRRVAVNASFNFDASVKQFVQLLSGRTIVLIPQESRADAAALLALIDAQRIDVIDCTPSQLKTWLSAGMLQTRGHRLRLVLVGGETIDPELWRELSQSRETEFFNVYGPTESTVDTSFARLSGERSAPHIGRPMENRRVYILDRNDQPVPIGAAGEICIAGEGIARGYLNRPDLTTERFPRDPFGTGPARMYRSGDLGRWRSNGTIEYLGRSDHQVKVRGFRIELGEIETQLLRHPDVKEAVVLACEDEAGDRRLIGYVTADVGRLRTMQHSDSIGAAEVEAVAQWERVHDETYSSRALGPSFVGWNSSYTNEPIPEPEMQEWLECTLDRIRALRPLRVLEIGCGVGLLLQHLAPNCEVYVGTDFAASALSQLERWMRGRDGFGHVELLRRSATELRDLPAGAFDTVVLNSVVQYFPDIDYLVAVLRGAVRLLAPGGSIFIGDVRHLESLRMFHSAVHLSKAGATVTAGQLKKRVDRTIAQEKELVIDPQFFQMLLVRVPGLSAAEIQLKHGRASNELTRYRYDVVLRAGEHIQERPIVESMRWNGAVGSIVAFEEALRGRRWRAARVSSIPNVRLSREALAQQLLETSDERLTASVLRRQLNSLPSEGIDPEKLWALGDLYGYEVAVSPGEHGCFDVEVVDRTRLNEIRRALPFLPEVEQPWSSFANDPLLNGLKLQLVPRLRESLKKQLPEYMIPTAWVVLDKMPLTPNGKLDRRALPVPRDRPEELGEYVAPGTELERVLADVWAQVLQVDQIGVEDNFFEIGGHSLLAMQMVTRIRSTLSIELPMRLLFEFPTIRQLCARVDELRDVRLRDEIAQGGSDIEELLGSVASMSESKVQALLNELRTRARP